MSRRQFQTCAVIRGGLLFLLLTIGGSATAQSPIENDECQNATPITDGTYLGTTVGATVDGESTACPHGTGPDVWFLYTATCDGLAWVDTCGSYPFDTNLSIQDPDCSGIEIACSEDDCGPPQAPWQSRVKTIVTTGEQYLIRVSGYESESGPFELHVSCSPAPPFYPGADHCENARVLDVPTIVRGSTSGADYDSEADRNIPGFPRDEGNWGCGRDSFDRNAVPGVWYRAAGTGNRMTVSVDNPMTFAGTRVQVYCDGCARPICVAGGENTPLAPGKDSSRVHATWCSRVNETYLIWAAAAQVTDAGEFELSVTDDGTPCFGAVDCTPIEVIDTYISDNGDEDGWADTSETVELRFSVANRSTRDVTGLMASLSTSDSNVAGVAESEVYIGRLSAGETKLAPGAFTFRVAEINRSSEDDEFLASLKVSFVSDQFEDLSPRRCSMTGVDCDGHEDCTGSIFCTDTRCVISGVPCRLNADCLDLAGDLCSGRCSTSGEACSLDDTASTCDTEIDFCVDESQQLQIDLDLDASGGSGPTEFFDSFESGVPAAFAEMNLDAGRHSPEASDGFRCQCSDFEEDPCILGANPGHADEYSWHLDDSRAFSGLYSLYMGVELELRGYTTPMASLEAAAINDTIHLGWGRACSGVTSLSCGVDDDCPTGERCLVVSPELSFKHQISLVDDRAMDTQGQGSDSQGVVQVQVVNSAGDPIGGWRTIEPKLNRYDSVPSLHHERCRFDPWETDDETSEDDLFDDYDLEPPVAMFGARYLSVGGWYVTHGLAALWRFGPSSICFPQRVFASAGDTDGPFGPDSLNGPAVGPGLQGEHGVGTWVEPVFSLDRFRGRSVRLRFLSSSRKGTRKSVDEGWETWIEAYGGNVPYDDGWWIDDVRVTHTLMDPAAVSVDTNDNSDLAYDADGDHVADTVDCAPNSDQTWALPGQVLDLRLTHSSGPGGTTTLNWARAATLGSTTVEYTLIAHEGTSCDESDVGGGHTSSDSVTPPPGGLRRFLVQAENGCGRGPLGHDSNHEPRTGCQ